MTGVNTLLARLGFLTPPRVGFVISFTMESADVATAQIAVKPFPAAPIPVVKAEVTYQIGDAPAVTVETTGDPVKFALAVGQTVTGSVKPVNALGVAGKPTAIPPFTLTSVVPDALEPPAVEVVEVSPEEAAAHAA